VPKNTIPLTNEELLLRSQLRIGAAGIALTLVVSAVFGYSTYRQQERMSAIEQDRHTTEQSDGDATDFVQRYFAGTCEQRADLMSFPLDQWLNWRNGVQLNVYVKEGERNIYIPTEGDPAGGQLGAVVVRGEEQAQRDAARSPKIAEALDQGYELAVGTVPATEREPVLSSCLSGRSPGRDAVEPEIPTEIVDISSLGRNRGMQVVVRVAADHKNADHVADQNAVYSLRLERAGGDGDLRLTAITGLAVSDPNAELLREWCALLRAQVEMSPGYDSYSKEGKEGIKAKCTTADPA